MTIIIGGWTPFMDYSDQTWYFNHIFKHFIKGPRLPVGRQGHSAGMLTDHGMARIICRNFCLRHVVV